MSPGERSAGVVREIDDYSQEDNLAAALAYAEDLGLPVLPVHGVRDGACACGDPNCRSPGKHPLTRHGLHDATTDANQIEQWWGERPNANIGISAEGLLVLDVDTQATWLNDEPEKLHDLVSAPQSRTASGGRHYVFRAPEDSNWRNTQGLLAPHVDTRSTGGYFVAPPSAIGNQGYHWVEGSELDEPIESLPEPPT